MAKLTIKGWDSGRNRVAMIALLIETLGLDDAGAKDLNEAIHFGKAFSLSFEDEEAANDLAEKLFELDANVEIE